MDQNINISPYLEGGIGNQLFEIAASYSLCLNKNYNLVINKSKKIGYGHTEDLSDYNYEELSDICKIFPNIKCSETFFKYDRIIKQKRDYWNNNIPLEYYVKPKDDINILLIGVFASFNYFKKNEDKVRELFQFSDYIKKISNEKFKNILDIENKVSLHFRRGDRHMLVKKKRKNWCVIDFDYYYKSIDRINNQNKNYTFILFYENKDKNWIKYYIIPYLVKKNIKYIDTLEMNIPSIITLYLISKCDHNIITESTFSFWGAFLNENKNKMVFIPRVYKNISNKYKISVILRGSVLSTEDEKRCPDDWIEIDTNCIT